MPSLQSSPSPFTSVIISIASFTFIPKELHFTRESGPGRGGEREAREVHTQTEKFREGEGKGRERRREKIGEEITGEQMPREEIKRREFGSLRKRQSRADQFQKEMKGRGKSRRTDVGSIIYVADFGGCQARGIDTADLSAKLTLSENYSHVQQSKFG